MEAATHPAAPPFTPCLPPPSSRAVKSEASRPLNSPETTSSRHSSDRSDASPSSSVEFTDSSTSATSSPLAPSCSSTTPESHASRDASDALPPEVAVKVGKCIGHNANPPTQPLGNTSFREKLFASLRLSREYIRHPPRLPVLVNAVVIVTMACGVFALLTGIYRVAFTSDQKRADLLEFSTQVLQAAGTVAALLLHPTRLVYLLRLVRWRPSDVISLRKVFSRGDAAVAKPHERRHMAVVIGLLNIACVSQYGIFLCLCLRAPADRRSFPVLVFVFGAFGLGTVAGVYFLLCPLGRPLPVDAAPPAAPEAHKRSAGTADGDNSTARGSPAEKLWGISSRGRGDRGEERGTEGSDRRERASVVRTLFPDEESGDGDSPECAGDDGNSDDADSSSSSSGSGRDGRSSSSSSSSANTSSGGSCTTDRYRHIQRTESHIEACPPLALPAAALGPHSSPSSPSSRSFSALSCHLGSSPDHHPSLLLGSARLQSSRSQRSSSRHVDKRAVWQPHVLCAGATAAQGAAATNEAPEWAGLLWGVADDCEIAARMAFCCPCAFAQHLQRAGFGHPFFHALNLLLFLLGPPLVFTASARFMTNPALHALTVAFGVAGALMGLLYGGYWRWKLRRTFDLPAQTWMCGHKAFSDFGTWVACPCCALCQEMRTVKAYGLRVVAPDDAQLEVIVMGGTRGVRKSSKDWAEQDSVTISVTTAPCVLEIDI
ncbi:unnamed protein product [Closterium sp. NIES-53]